MLKLSIHPSTYCMCVSAYHVCALGNNLWESVLSCRVGFRDHTQFVRLGGREFLPSKPHLVNRVASLMTDIQTKAIYINVILVGTSPMTSEVQQFFMCLLMIRISSFPNRLFLSLFHLRGEGWGCFLIDQFFSSLFIPLTNPLRCVANKYFSSLWPQLFALLHRFFFLWDPICWLLTLFPWQLGSYTESPSLTYILKYVVYFFQVQILY